MRNKKISADISDAAFDMLNKLVEDHERSKGWLLDRMIKKFCSAENVTEKEKDLPKSKISYPSNFEEQFELLWLAKGKKGSKKIAKDRYKRLCANSSKETCESLTNVLISDINAKMSEIGFEELHLSTYINQERWES